MRALYYGLLVSLLLTAMAVGIGCVLLGEWPTPEVALIAIALLVVGMLPPL